MSLIKSSLQNRRNFLRISVEKGRKSGERVASAKRELRVRGGSLKNPACPHTIVQAVPAFKYVRGYLIGCIETRDPRMFFQDVTQSRTVNLNTTDRFALKLFGEFNWKYGPIGLICSL